MVTVINVNNHPSDIDDNAFMTNALHDLDTATMTLPAARGSFTLFFFNVSPVLIDKRSR